MTCSEDDNLYILSGMIMNMMEHNKFMICPTISFNMANLDGQFYHCQSVFVSKAVLSFLLRGD